MVIPSDVKYILDNIKNSGYTALVVGGAIRDILLHKEPKDYDIATNCPYEVLMEIFKEDNPKEIGKAFGIIQVSVNGIAYEIAKFRNDGEYKDNRKPDSVNFVVDFLSDSSRRDFTINGFGFDGDILYDYHYGMTDLHNKIINFIGKAEERIQEDALRMLRAVRFASVLNFSLGEEVFWGIRDNVNLIENISKERIRGELNKILLSDSPSYGIDLLHSTNLLKYIIPELEECYRFQQNNPHHDKNVYDHILSTVNNTKPILINRLSALFHDIGKPQTFSINEEGIGHFYGHDKASAEIAEAIMRRLKYDNETIEKIKVLILNHMNKKDKITRKACKRFINRVGVNLLDSMLDLMKADVLGGLPPFDFRALNHLMEVTKDILESKEPLQVNQLAVNGNDLKELGMKEGRRIGEVLSYLQELVLEDCNLNEKEVLLEIVNKFKMENV